MRTANTSIRIDPDILHLARVAAVTNKVTLGTWLEDAIVRKLNTRGRGRPRVKRPYAKQSSYWTGGR